MLIFALIVFVVIAAGFVGIVIKNSRKWALALQKIYVKEGEKLFGDSSSWKEMWVRVLLQVIIIFASVILVLMTFSLTFGTIHSERSAAGQVEWSLQK